jgi:pimeloyl-ACP methyl ester carboxylesterase
MVAPGTFDSRATRYTVIALDQRCHGASDKPLDPAAYGIHLVEDAVRLLEHLCVGRAHVIGYSMGGLITLNLMTRHPERVASAVLGGFAWPDALSTLAHPAFLQTRELIAEANRGGGLNSSSSHPRDPTAVPRRLAVSGG